MAYQNGYFTGTSSNPVWTGNTQIRDSSNNIISPQILIAYMNSVMPLLKSGIGAT